MALAGIHSWCGRNGWAWGHQRTDIDSSAGEDCQIPLAVEDYWKSDLLALWWIWDHFKTLGSHPVWIQTLIGDMVRAVSKNGVPFISRKTVETSWNHVWEPVFFGRSWQVMTKRARRRRRVCRFFQFKVTWKECSLVVSCCSVGCSAWVCIRCFCFSFSTVLSVDDTVLYGSRRYMQSLEL